MAVLCPLWAREVTVTVADADLEIPLEGAVIRSWDGAEYVCDEEGRAAVSVPEGRQVVIQAAYPGYNNGRLVIPAAGNEFSIGLRLGGVMENRELVVEARKPDTGETKSGRSVAISGETLSRTAEIGFIEDVMTSIKLLPGVGYAGMFDAMPSIRGGDPGDLTAALDGFYIEHPYHWGGAYSIFVPQMVENARLSHGIFSGRYGHTISGLLEITTKSPSPTETQLDLGVSTSETNLNLSFPLWGKGGVMVMGKVTYWDPFVWGVQQLAGVFLEKQIADAVNAVTTAPYIRDFAATGNYRFSPDLELTSTLFAGGDGVGINVHNLFEEEYRERDVNLDLKWLNFQAFGIAALTWNPRNDMALRSSMGTGYYETDVLADIDLRFDSSDFGNTGASVPTEDSIPQHILMNNTLTETAVTWQGRTDFDWDLGSGLIFAAGLHELYTQWLKSQALRSRFDVQEVENADRFTNRTYNLDVQNQGLATAAYGLGEAQFGRIGAELGLRIDHFYFIGRDFTIQTAPVLNPRLNVDFQVCKNQGIIDSFALTAGTGLFSSINDVISYIDISNGIRDFELRPNRSWTSLLGAKLDLSGGVSFNIEGYYKHVFDRAYSKTTRAEDEQGNTTVDYWFDGTGRVAGFDLMLQKLESRYFDGWLSYSFNWVNYREPNDGGYWYYPSFHRFHVMNLVMNIKPSQKFNLGIRFGFASGKQDNRDIWSFPTDMKFSWYQSDPEGKVRTEIYLGIENLQALILDAMWISQAAGYTGDEDMSEYMAAYDLPVPLVSFGFKWSY
ncbi:MAG: hypothetical protein LBS97_07685 [Treponema sp.]|nr:hypothetical protein [Treponema sp.]